MRMAPFESVLNAELLLREERNDLPPTCSGCVDLAVHESMPKREGYLINHHNGEVDDENHREGTIISRVDTEIIG